MKRRYMQFYFDIMHERGIKWKIFTERSILKNIVRPVNTKNGMKNVILAMIVWLKGQIQIQKNQFTGRRRRNNG